MLCLKNVTAVLESGVQKCCIYIDGEKICGITAEYVDKGCGEIDCEGKIAVPGGVDPHVHFTANDEIYKESCSALYGGTTSIIDFCEPRKNQSAEQALKWRTEKISPSAADYSFHFGFTENYAEELEKLDLISEAGINSYKLYTCYDGTALDYSDMEKVITAVSDRGACLIHSEDRKTLKQAAQHLILCGRKGIEHFPESRPAEAEIRAVKEIEKIRSKTGAKLCIAHVSCGETLKISDELFYESCPQYLAFDESVFSGENGRLYTCAPTIKNSREELWNGIMSGRIKIFSSDHFVFPKEEKLSCNEFTEAKCGIGGVDVRMSFMFSEGVMKRGLDLKRYVELTAENAAKLYGIYPQKGVIAEGSDADIVIFDSSVKYKYRLPPVTRQDFSVYDGMEMQGAVAKVFRRGELVRNGSEFIAPKKNGVMIRQARLKCV